MRHHQSQKHLQNDFDRVWGLLDAFGRQPLLTPKGHEFVAFAAVTTRGSHKGERVVRIQRDSQEYARIYPCCWRRTTNCNGTRIGGYSDALDSWCGLQP